MKRRDVVRCVMDGGKPPYVPWSMGFTQEAREKLAGHFGAEALDGVLRDHLFCDGPHLGSTDLGNSCRRDAFGAVWDRSVDKDIGQVKGVVLAEPTLHGYEFPRITDDTFKGLRWANEVSLDRYLVCNLGFSLWERAWTLRGMENLMMDLCVNPGFARELFERIGEWNVAAIKRACRYDFDAVLFGDDWGTQRGLQMGYAFWREFIYPVLTRMYAAAHDAGKKVMIHSCGKVDELFGDLCEIGLNCFNPFQPEVMNVWELLPRYRGRLAFHGGLSTQRTLPYGTPDEVRDETRRLLALGADGGYIFAPAHAVEGDVPLENMLAMIDEVTAQARIREAEPAHSAIRVRHSAFRSPYPRKQPETKKPLVLLTSEPCRAIFATVTE
jgi:uroporphyrinogen decarboxylase